MKTNIAFGAVSRRSRRTRQLVAAFLASTALVSTPVAPAQALDAFWQLMPSSDNLTDGTNWLGGSVPTGTATFGMSDTTSVLRYMAYGSFGGWSFTTYLSYEFLIGGGLSFTGSGITNVDTAPVVTNNGTLVFSNASSAGNATIVNNGSLFFQNSSSAGSATITHAGSATFYDSSTAGSATIGLTGPGVLTFRDTSTAGSATINVSATSSLHFWDTSTAGSATITTATSAMNDASVTFNNASTAGSATITNGGQLEFDGQSSAATATIGNTRRLTFRGSSSAGTATITNTGEMGFLFSSTAGSATITNNGNLLFAYSSTAGSAVIGNASTGTMVFYDQSTAGSANLDNSGTLNFTDSSTAGSATITNRQGGATTFSGTSKAGSAAITNTGDLIFIDSATADGSTITNAGRTSFEGGSSAAASNITNQSGGTLAFYNTSTAGTATITNQTGGYAGFAAYSTAGSATIVNNGAFLFLNFASAASATITNNGGMAFGEGSTADHATITNNDFLEFSGIGTAGSATITGNGTLRFIQDSTTGNASITTGGMVQLATNDTTGAATVAIQSGGILSGFGSVGNTTIQSGGTIAASGGTLQINGNLTLGPGSLYGVCTCAMTAVTGTATLGGAALVLPPSLAQPSFQGGQSYTVLTATGGVNGTFGTVNSPLVSVLYGTNDVSITIAAYTTGAALDGTGGTNARNVGGALDRVIVASAGAPPTSLNPLLGLFGAPLANAMNGLSGEAATGAQASAFTSASTFLGIMLDPMAGARGATAAAPGSSLIQMADTGRTPAARVTAGWSVWTKSFGQAGRTASDAATGAAGTASSLYGVAAGADRLISPDTLIGFALAGGGTAYGLGTRGTGSGDFAQLGLYGSTRLGPGYVSAALAYGWNRFDVSRTAGLGPTETYRSAPTVHTFGGRIEAGRRFGDRAFAATPYAALEVIGASTAGYRESWGPGNTGAFALAYGARTYANARAEAGMRLDSLRAVAPTADLLTFARLAYGFQAGTQRSAEASFQQLANSGFTVFGARASTHTALGSLGLELRLATGTRVTASLDGELGDRHRSLRANAGISHNW